MILYFLTWIFWGLVIGFISKKLHPGEDPDGCLSTILIGIAGSFVGGFMSFIFGISKSPFGTSGLLMSIVGGIVCCFAYSWFLKNKYKGN